MFHLAGNPHYGFFRDELYFIACGRHPAFGYVDQPPLIPLLDAFSQSFGPSLVALRALPALCAGAAVYASCLLAFAFGGGVFAAVLAALATALAPVLASFGTLAVPDAMNVWTWPIAALFILQALRGNDRAWLLAGVALGIAAEAKYSVAFFGAALIAGIALTPQRSAFAKPWFWAGCGAAVLLGIPSVLWQFAHGLPMIELLRHGQLGKNIPLTPLSFMREEIVITGLILAPLWFAGLVRLLLKDNVRPLGYTVLVFFATMIALHAKSYYLAPVFPILFAAGSVAVERATQRAPLWRPVALAAVLTTAILLPFSLPVFSEASFLRYQRALHVSVPRSENHAEPLLPQVFADMHGWPELTATVARVYFALPESERRKAAIFTSNYGEAAAIDFYGARYGLPHAISGHNNYFLWGRGTYDGSVLIDVSATIAGDRHLCYDVWPGTTFSNPFGMPSEDQLGIVVCERLRLPVERMWSRQRHYD